ncbi:MAG: cation transporter, partial [Deltaproteobacteria bacterium]|nr:cation transporter [Deltaproteobacteria bacterium]
MEKVFYIEGVTCAGCLAEIERTLYSLGITDYEIDTENLRLITNLDDKEIEKIAKELEKKGYRISQTSRPLTAFPIIVSFPFVLALNIIHFFGAVISQELQFVLSLPVLVTLAPRILKNAILKGLKTISLEFFVSLSVIAGVILTVFSVAVGDYSLFFAETYSTILFIICLGTY